MRRQLILVATAATVTITLAFLIPLALLVRTVAHERALTSARQAATALAPVVVAGDDRALSLAVQTVSTSAPGPVSLVLPDGRVIGAPVDPDAALLAGQAGTASQVTSDDGAVTLTTPLLDDSGATAVAQVVVPPEALRRGVVPAWTVLAVLGIALVGLTIAITDRLGRSVVRSSQAVADAARGLAAGDRQARAPTGGPPEVADVAAALNALADRIDALVAAEREAAADLSHRLRTPLTALRLDVEALGDTPAARRLAADADELQRAVDRLIREARMPGVRVDRQADAAAIVAERARFWGALAEDEGRPWSVEVPESTVPTEISVEELTDVCDVLLGNVLTHTPPGTGCRIDLDRNGPTLTIDDDGPGWPDDEVTARGRSGVGSTGLGLDIVQRTAQRYGGRLLLAQAPGGGARAIVQLGPVSQGP